MADGSGFQDLMSGVSHGGSPGPASPESDKEQPTGHHRNQDKPEVGHGFNRNGDSFRDLMTGVARGVTGLVSENEHYQHIGQIRNQAKPGDILEVQRDTYTHYALFLGDGKVMNVDVEDNRASAATIRERTLLDVFDGCKVRLRGHEDVARSVFDLSPKPDEDIVQTAMTFKNKVVPYEFDFRNCEYYCTLWRYGKGFSTQAAQQASAPVGSALGFEADDNTSATFFQEDGYAKYKELAKDEELAQAITNETRFKLASNC